MQAKQVKAGAIMANKDQETTQHDSNICSFPNAESGRTAIKEQASLWIVRLDRGDLSPQETHELQQWQARSDFHREYLEKLARNWDDMAVMQELAALFPINGVHTTSSLGERLRSGFTYLLRPPVWVASSLAIFGLLAVVMLNQPPHHFQTGIGEQASYTLEDGSSIHLNTNTSLDIDYSDERRVIKLHRGEANFNVAKNPERPFVVYAGEGMVWAVGTAFNVRYIDGQNDQYIDVTVTEGTVKVLGETSLDNTQEVANPIDLATLHAGQVGTLERVPTATETTAGQSLKKTSYRQTLESIDSHELDRQLAWHKGLVMFAGETLQQVVHEISRYSGLNIQITDPALSQLKIGGQFRIGETEAMFNVLESNFNIQISHLPGGQISLSAGQQH